MSLSGGGVGWGGVGWGGVGWGGVGWGGVGWGGVGWGGVGWGGVGWGGVGWGVGWGGAGWGEVGGWLVRVDSRRTLFPCYAQGKGAAPAAAGRSSSAWHGRGFGGAAFCCMQNPGGVIGDGLRVKGIVQGQGWKLAALLQGLPENNQTSKGNRPLWRTTLVNNGQESTR